MKVALTLILLCVLSAWTQIPDVTNVLVICRTENELTFQWEVENSSYSYKLQINDKDPLYINSSETDAPVNVQVTSLSPGTKYFFKLYTVFGNDSSKGHDFSEVTVPSAVDSVSVITRNETEIKLQWNKVNNNNDYSYKLKYRNNENTSISALSTDSTVEHIVESLSSGTEYFFMLYTVFENVMSRGYNFSNVTMPSNVENVMPKLNDTDMILQWNVVPNIDNNSYNYTLEYKDEPVDCINYIAERNEVTCHISDLIPGTNYSYTLYTEFADLRSTGFNFYQITTLSDITGVTVKRSQTSLTISWSKLNNNDIYNYTLQRLGEESEIHFTGSDKLTYTYSSLTPGTEHSFSLFTEVNNARSTGYSFKNVTTLNCASFNWTVTTSSIEAAVNGCTYVTAQNSTGIGKNDIVDDNRVNLQDLYPGESYTVSLFYDLESEKLLQCSHRLTLVPNSVSDLRCTHHSGGYGLAVMWDSPNGVLNMVQVDVGKQSFNQSHNSEKTQQVEVKGLQAAQWYTVTATSFSGDMRSQTVSVNCQTNPAGVIAGVLVFFLLIIIICVAVFVWHRYGSAKHNKMPRPPVESKVPNKNNKYVQIPLDKFPEYFQIMSRDENKGFSEEYEDLSSVGIKESSIAALLPENKDKNRFSNVLAYDSSRVHLSTNDEGDSDYINANYMPGYGNANRQYIAAQGPLPSTVNDFWRMVWEKRSQVIVMVTNCTESGRVKCEQYWPLDYTPCLYGHLLVTIKSEDTFPSWTLREFNIKNKTTSETRTVRHFHFTAWPDHGVPTGTEELIQFRGLIRQHIESSFSAGPTIVHCSAGVGRTGTLIALDVLLQQLDKEKEVGISAFVQQMRLSRPLMVQTESQYVFLHQCIMDTLQPKVVPKSEPLYENTDMIYVNAIALREYEKQS
ncbi:receptor-type tyrosine-protein phosphatase H-like isoform X1 [Carassius carassius]|uniref:receptor-type tyrosine-protein phosphatase H-like isoform X1 n=1 Tax=Carassius carassius TaxID=217509 RepID=UPI0028688589|nr:receptor-type tyrosine-protein phosphatase H-like isoform X1 [Carassius carassius]